MAPEQLAGLPAVPHSDQFAFCAALWEALCDGEPAFAGADPAELLAAMRSAPRRPPAASPVPAGIFTLLERGLAARPEDRHPDLQVLLDAITPLAMRRRASDRGDGPFALLRRAITETRRTSGLPDALLVALDVLEKEIDAAERGVPSPVPAGKGPGQGS
jgi:hypothetical protein